MNVFVVAPDHFGVASFFKSAGFTVVKDVRNADLAVLTGGEDIAPVLYGEPTHPTCHASFSRDAVELKGAQDALDLNIPIFGICRGAQLLNVLCGGKMFQHIVGHHGPHAVEWENKKWWLNSHHHQMMRPGYDADEVYTTPMACRAYDGYGNVHDLAESVEIVYYKDKKVLCMQSHPEFASSQDDDTARLALTMLNHYFNIS